MPHNDYVPCDLASWAEMPSHWRIGRIKFMTTMNPSKSEVRHLKSDTPVTFLPMEAIGDDGRLDVSKERPLHSVVNGYTYLAEGDVCIAKITPCFENGKGAIVIGLQNGIGFATTEVIPMRCNRTTDSHFLYYFLTCPPFNRDAEATMYGAGGQKRVADSFVANYSAAIPPLAEQKQIAAFLDYETAKIDALIEKQQQLIALLGEKRQAVISHAVTKGLNPDAPLRDSGVEWLGEVPAHWTLPPLYARYEQVLGKMLDHSKMTGLNPTPYLRNLDVRWDSINIDDLPIMDIKPHEQERFMVRKGDLLMVEGRELGRGAIWMGEDNVVAFQKALHRLRPLNATEHARFLYYTMAHAHSTGVFLANQTPNEIPHLTGQELRRYRFPKPPIEEQTAITRFLDEKTARLDVLVSDANSVIELLQERRSSLISAAVTGKIDVRGWKRPSSDIELEVELAAEVA
jgi:type I restriction enzyme S subunit